MEQMTDGERSIAVADVAERILQPAAVDDMASRATDDELLALCGQIKVLQGISWTTHCILIGHMLHRVRERARTDPKSKTLLGVRELARQLEMPMSEVSRAASVFHEIILPRIQAQGAAAVFPVRGRSYYDLAIRAAHATKKPALPIFEAAEALVIDGGYSLRRFKQDLIDSGAVPRSHPMAGGSLEDLGHGFLVALRTLVTTHDDTITWLLEEKPQELLDAVEPMMAMLAKIARELAVAPSPVKEYDGDSATTNDAEEEDEVDFVPDGS